MRGTLRYGICLGMLLCLFTASGCATIFTVSESHDVVRYGGRKPSGCDVPLPQIYSGTLTDMRVILYLPLEWTDFCSSSNLGLITAFYFPVSFVDLPLSFAADTVLLPYTIYRQSVYGNIRNRER